MKKAVLIIGVVGMSLALAGCASWGDYASEVRTVNAQIAAEKKADREREQREEGQYLQAMANAQSDVARVAMAGFWALSKAKGGGAAQSPGYLVPQPPKDVLDSVATLAGVLVPTLGNVAIAAQNARVSMRQSDNAARVSESSNSAMVALGTQGSSVARDLVGVLPSLRPSMTFTIGRDGTIGDGTFAPVTQALTTGGDGILGGGTISRPANPSRVCSVDPTTGAVNCSP